MFNTPKLHMYMIFPVYSLWYKKEEKKYAFQQILTSFKNAKNINFLF